jgi:hypothetical protein
MALGSAGPAFAQNPASPPSASAPLERLVTFDYHLARLDWTGGRWQLWAGPIWLKDFGRHEAEAREALRIVRDLRLTQHGTIGTPQAVMEYWLSAGQAPHESVPGMHLTAFEPDSLRVELIHGQWSLRDASRVLFSFGLHEDQAQQALAIVHRYGFNQVGFLGSSVPDMVYFLAGPSRSSQPSLSKLPSLASRTHIATDPTPRPDPAAPVPAGGTSTAALEERIPLDWSQVQIRHEGAEYKLVHGNYTLANFGPHEELAREALATVRYYRFTEHCLVGTPTPSFSYFLTNGQAPHGLRFGIEAVPFRPETLRLQQFGARSVIWDGNRALLDFGTQVEDARLVLQIIQQHRFDHLCRVGPRGSASLTFFVRTR